MRILFLLFLFSLNAAVAAADDEELAALWIQGQALFYDLRDLESLSHRERIRILEQAEDCIQQVQDRQAFRRCERIEQEARRQLRTELREERQRLRDRRDALLDRL